MRVRIVTPAPPRSLRGNRRTAVRWAGILRGLGHRVTIEQEYSGGSCDLLVALHARRSAASVRRFRRLHPGAPMIVALTGTDLYGDMRRGRTVLASLERATRIVVLQRLAVAALPARLRPRARTILQSTRPPRGTRRAPAPGSFDVCVLGHLRPVKDPFRAARAARRLPADSRIRIVQIGAAIGAAMARRARAEQARNPRYVWLGEMPRSRALRRLSACRLLALTSRMEGGANVVSEAIVCGVPVVSSRIAGSIGLLGRGYPGTFEPGDTRGLALLLERLEARPALLARLERHCRRLRPLFRPERETRAWRELLDEIRTGAA